MIIERSRVKELVSRFEGLPVAVIGDLILDQFIWGRVERISPEAPVPVIEITNETVHLGGAANVAANLLSLGAKPVPFGVVGDDDAGARLLRELERVGMQTDGVVIDRGRATTVKTRIIAHHQQVCRADKETRKPITEALHRLVAVCAQIIPDVVGVVLSDYAKGVLVPHLVQEAVKVASKNGRFVAVDPKVEDFALYRGASIITPNKREAERASGIQIVDQASLVIAGKILLETTGAEHILITRGEEGMSLCNAEGCLDLPTVAQEVYDVTGAGDTVIATLSAALGADATVREAAFLANHAAGVVVGKLGTASLTREELLLSVENC